MEKFEEKLKTLWDGEVPDGNTADRLRTRLRDRLRTRLPDMAERRMRIAAAACLILAFGIGGFTALCRPAPTYAFTAGNGVLYEFPPLERVSSLSLHPDFPVVTRVLTEEENESIFRRTSIRDGFPLANDDLVWRGGDSSGKDADAPDFSNGIANDDLVWRQRGPVTVSDTEQSAGQIVPYGNPEQSSDARYVLISSGEETESPLPASVPAADTAPAVRTVGTFRADTGELIRTEGEVGGTKIVCAAPGIGLTDAVVSEGGAAAQIGGHEVTLGSFTTRPNSNGRRTALFCAYFDLDTPDGETWRAYAEAAGDLSAADETAQALLWTVGSMVAGESDFGAVRN